MIRVSTAGLLWLVTIALAKAAPPLPQTTLFKDIAHDCRQLDIATWKHPARVVLKKAGIEPQKVELCNDGKFPIFTASLGDDPRLPGNSHYFNRLFVELAKANGWWPYALVDGEDGVVVSVTAHRKPTGIDVDMEDFQP